MKSQKKSLTKGLETKKSESDKTGNSKNNPFPIVGIGAPAGGLEEELQKFKTVFEQSNYSMAIVDFQGNIRYINESFAEAHGYCAEELVGKNLNIFHTEEQMARVMEINSRLIKTGSYSHEEVWHVKTDGTVFPMLMNGVVIYNSKGEPDFLATTAIDVTDRKQAEEALQETQKRLVEAQHIAKMGDFTWDVTTGETTWSDGLYDLLKYDKTKKIDFAIVNKEIHHPDDLEDVTQWLNTCIALEKGILTPKEYRLIRKDGEVIYVRTEGVIQHNSGGSARVFATLHDITESKQAEQALIESETKFKRLSNLTFEGIVLHQNGIAIDINLSFSQIFGYTREEVIGKNIVKLIVKEEYHNIISQNLIKNYSFPYEIGGLRKDGTEIPLEIEGRDVESDNKTIRVAAVRDISERKKFKKELIKAKETAERYLDVSGSAFVSLDINGNILLINQKGLKILEYDTSEELVGKNWFDTCLPSEVIEPVKQVFANVMKGDIEGVENFENEVVTKSGNRRLIYWSNSYIKDEEGQIKYLLSSGIDITERKQAEQALIESEVTI